MTTNDGRVRRVEMVVAFTTTIPTDPDDGDRFADDLGDKIKVAIGGIPEVLGVGEPGDHVDVLDWTDVDPETRR